MAISDSSDKLINSEQPSTAFQFGHIRQYQLIILLLVCLIGFFAHIPLLIRWLSGLNVPGFLQFGACFVLPLAIWISFRKMFLLAGNLEIQEDSFLLDLGYRKHRLTYAELRSYSIDRYNGIQLNLYPRDGKAIRVVVNNRFNDEAAFEVALQALIPHLHKAGVQQQKSPFRLWLIGGILLILSLAIPAIMLNQWQTEARVTGSLWLAIPLLAGMWYAYLKR